MTSYLRKIGFATVMDRLPTSTSDSATRVPVGELRQRPCASANPSFEWTRSGTTLPRGAVVHVAPRGQGAIRCAPSAQTLGSASLHLRPCERIRAAGRQFVARTWQRRAHGVRVSSSNHPPETAVLASIPVWVPVLFLGLVFLGYRQSLPRTVKLARWLPSRWQCSPSRSTAWSARLALSRCLLLLWAAAYAMAVFLGATFFAPRGLVAVGTSVHVPGSWVPLVLLLAIFAAKFALGFAAGVRSPLLHHFGFIATMSAVLGAPERGFGRGRSPFTAALPPPALPNPSLVGLPPARHLARAPASVIIRRAGQAPSRRQPLSSNVRPHTTPESPHGHRAPSTPLRQVLASHMATTLPTSASGMLAMTRAASVADCSAIQQQEDHHQRHERQRCNQLVASSLRLELTSEAHERPWGSFVRSTARRMSPMMRLMSEPSVVRVHGDATAPVLSRPI